MLPYVCWGKKRGYCGHKHRSILAAYRCEYKDFVDCERKGIISDRNIKRFDNTPISEDEDQAIHKAIRKIHNIK